MVAKKRALKSLPKKPVNAKKADSVKGGKARPRIALNHNQILRTL